MKILLISLAAHRTSFSKHFLIIFTVSHFILFLFSNHNSLFFIKITYSSSILTDLLTWAETYVQTTGTKYLPISVITPTNSLSNINLNNSQKSKGSGQVLTFGSFHHTDQNYMTEDEEEEEGEIINRIFFL